jgi:hypothetical protein
LESDPDFKEYFDSYDPNSPRYNDDEVGGMHLDEAVVVVNGELLDGYNRCTLNIHSGNYMQDAYINLPKQNLNEIRKLIREVFNEQDDKVEKILKNKLDLDGFDIRKTDNIKEMENIETLKSNGLIIKYKKDDFMKWLFYEYEPVGTAKAKVVQKTLQPKIISKKIYTQSEMIPLGANYHLQHGMLMMIPVDKVDGLDPTPGGYYDDIGDYVDFKPGKKIEKPIEVVYDLEIDLYMLYDGNHRVTQAKMNGDKYIKAFVQADKNTYNKWKS